MEQKMTDILKFLDKNKKYNQELQIRFAINSVGCQQTSFDKLVALLYDTVNTQSQPKMDLLACFFKNIYENREKMENFTDFVKYICNDKYVQENPFKSLYCGLKTKDGWGEKTSALFVKNLYNYHYNFKKNEEPIKELIIWNDMPELNDQDKLYLPVDGVIKFIFNTVSPKINRNGNPRDWTFEEINKKFKGYSNKDIILLDDLWFWGFVTQKIENQKRVLEWNGEKYWMLKESIKDKRIIVEIRKLSREFIKIINSEE